MTSTAARPSSDIAILWDPSAMSGTRAACVWAAFFSAYLGLVLLGYAIKEHLGALTLIWPSQGLLFVALWWLRVRWWPLVLALQVLAEQVASQLAGAGWGGGWEAVFVAANFADAAVAGLLCRRVIARPLHPHVAQVVTLFSVLAVSAAAGATIGAWGATRAMAATSYLEQWQIWWASNLLGSLALAPVVMSWTIRVRVPALSEPPPHWGALAALGSAVVGGTFWIFSLPSAGASTLLQMPFVLSLLLVVAVFALPPRWAALLSAVSALLAAYLASEGRGPFADDPSMLARLGALQWFLASELAIPFLLGIALVERSRTSRELEQSEERHRSFVELGTEAVWRIEIDPPAPLSLPLAAQAEWIGAHGKVVESSRSAGVFRPPADPGLRGWQAEVPWADVLMRRLAEAAPRRYSIDGLAFDHGPAGRVRHYVAHVVGVVEHGQLRRLWGVARDLTELVAVNRQLELERTRLRIYAQQLTTAEDRARRMTAVDLHDGIAQMVAAVAMQLGAHARGVPPAVAPQVAAIQDVVRDIHHSIRRIVADLSPPGLYDIGLVPALMGLADRFGQRHGLQVVLSGSVDEDALALETRVLAFRIIDELLRNVAMHARTDRAAVEVASDGGRLTAVVRDRGVGFDTAQEVALPGQEHFGLWSIADRVRDARGTFEVHSAPGHGCIALLALPLDAAGSSASGSVVAHPLSFPTPGPTA